MQNEQENEHTPTLHDTFAELLRIAIWARECVPDTLDEHYGDIEPTIRRAQRILAEMEMRRPA